jgi:hypothetical protein
VKRQGRLLSEQSGAATTGFAARLAYVWRVDDDVVRAALPVVRAAERLSYWAPRDWPDLAVELLLAGADDAEIAELAGLPASVTGWDTDPLVAGLCDRYDVPVPGTQESVILLARLMATDLRIRPAAVTAPMIRLVARLALPAGDSDLAFQCAGSEEYLDCDCAGVDPRFETELEDLASLHLRSHVVQILGGPLRSTLPNVPPPHGH